MMTSYKNTRLYFTIKKQPSVHDFARSSHVIKYIENFSGDFSSIFLASCGRVVGPERKWWDLGPTLSAASAATGSESTAHSSIAAMLPTRNE